MNRVITPEPEIKLYKDRFEHHDQLGRSPTGADLSELVDKIEKPLVIALDGSWGSGKSFFLKCWVGEHSYRYGSTNQTVYFDAFKHDYLDDPIVALTGAITGRFREQEDEQQEQNQRRTQKLRKAAWAVSKVVGRIALSAAIHCTTETLSDLGDEIAKTVGQEAKDFLEKEQGNKDSKKFWDAHHAKIAAMDAFRLALEELTKPNDAEPIKLVIVIDELDRCRPDYALSLLEIIKHFFNVEGVHFVLGVNLSELQNIVRARYGSNIDAATYLQKFYSVVLSLPRKVLGEHDYLRYFDDVSGQFRISISICEAARGLLASYVGSTQMTPRTVQRILAVLALVPTYNKRPDLHNHPDILAGAAIAKVCAPQVYQEMRSNKLRIGELEKIFYLKDGKFEYWKHVIHTADGEGITFHGELPIPAYALQRTCEELLEVFDTSALQIT